MADPFVERGEQIKQALLSMERSAQEQDLFSLGYMIPQIELVLEMADYDIEHVTAEDFDDTYWEWLQHVFLQDGMSEQDCELTTRLWQEARQAA
ncbi:hypothetical protein [Carnimonas nigrificans]|uniref:hypothetical protein n=1 Tax=Carnimonas nigrificans TaxID=64323 RepID=UPI0004720328|nr:hypothetical protein [Carnimonas nigrificans]